MPEHQQDQPTYEDWLHYSVHGQSNYGGKERQPPPPAHALSCLLIADMFQEGLEELITKAPVLFPGEADPLFG